VSRASKSQKLRVGYRPVWRCHRRSKSLAGMPGRRAPGRWRHLKRRLRCMLSGLESSYTKKTRSHKNRIKTCSRARPRGALGAVGRAAYGERAVGACGTGQACCRGLQCVELACRAGGVRYCRQEEEQGPNDGKHLLRVKLRLQIYML